MHTTSYQDFWRFQWDREMMTWFRDMQTYRSSSVRPKIKLEPIQYHAMHNSEWLTPIITSELKFNKV